MFPAITILASLLYAFLILRSEVNHDYKRWKTGRYSDIKHGKRWRLRAIMMVPTIAGLTIALNPTGHQLLYVPLIVTGLVAFGWWLLFDGWLNNKRGFNWWFTGTNDPNDAHTDDFIQRLRKWQHIAVKVGSLILFVSLYLIILFQNG